MSNQQIFLDILLGKFFPIAQFFNGISVEEDMIEIIFIKLSAISENSDDVDDGLADDGVETWNIGEVLESIEVGLNN